MMIKWIERAIFQPGCAPLTALIIYLLAFDVLMQSGGFITRQMLTCYSAHSLDSQDRWDAGRK